MSVEAHLAGCCCGECNYSVGRVACNPWVETVPTGTCIPATGPFYGNNTTTKGGLTHSFQTCYKYGNDGTNVCYTQSWTDGAGYYYQCSPKDPYETFTYEVPWCGEPCQELLPAFKECVAHDQICVDDDDCCEDSTCSVPSGPPWNEVTLCSPTPAECESWGYCWCSIFGAFQCSPCYCCRHFCDV